MDIPVETRFRLQQAAREAARHSYCPYSGFPVGAAVLTASGAIFAGCNMENASLGLTICAERSAIAKAVCEGERRILALVVYTPTAMPTTPCGACRQVLAEFADNAVVACLCEGGDVLETTLSALLPAAFAAAKAVGKEKGGVPHG